MTEQNLNTEPQNQQGITHNGLRLARRCGE